MNRCSDPTDLGSSKLKTRNEHAFRESLKREGNLVPFAAVRILSYKEHVENVRKSWRSLRDHYSIIMTISHLIEYCKLPFKPHCIMVSVNMVPFVKVL